MTGLDAQGSKSSNLIFLGRALSIYRNISYSEALLETPTHCSAVIIMSSIRRMMPMDLLSLNLTNLDPLTENYDIGFYLNYLMQWPSLFSAVQDRTEGIVGYST